MLDKALLLYSQIVNLQAPAHNTFKAYKRWFEPTPQKTRLRGHSSHILDDESDLVALRIPANQDRLTRIVQTYFPWLFLVSHSHVENRPRFPSAKNQADRNSRRSHRHHLRAKHRPLCRRGQRSPSCHLVDRRHCSIELQSFDRQANRPRGDFHDDVRGERGPVDQREQDRGFAATAAYTAVLVVFLGGNSVGKN